MRRGESIVLMPVINILVGDAFGGRSVVVVTVREILYYEK